MDYLIGFIAALLTVIIVSAFNTQAEKCITRFLDGVRKLVKCIGGCFEANR